MKKFPDFMIATENSVSAKSQSQGVKGWVYEGADEKQMTYWYCETDGISKEHIHEYDEYFIVVEGEYILRLEGKEIELNKGDEYHIKPNVAHSGKFKAGTRTIHCFGGKRVILA